MTQLKLLTEASAQSLANLHQEPTYVALCPRFAKGDGGLVPLILFERELMATDQILRTFLPEVVR